MLIQRTHFFKLLFALFAASVFVSVFAQDVNDGLWDERFGSPGVTCCVGFSFDVITAETGPDGIYVGGTFQQLGEQYGTRGIARWDGQRWHSLDGGLFESDSLGGDVYDIAIDGDNVYAVGTFHFASDKEINGIARWHIPSQEWFPVGSGRGPEEPYGFGDLEPSAPSAVAVIDGDVYIGGSFEYIDGLYVRRAARWNGTSWSSLANGLYYDGVGSGNNAKVRTIAGVNGLVYVGGNIGEVWNRDHLAENVDVNYLAVYDPNTDIWSDVGGGTSASVRTLTAAGDALYVGGGFYRAGGSTVNGIAKWQNGQWSALETGVDGYVDSIKVVGEDVYVSGGFYDASGVADTDSLARWDGSQWHGMGTSDFFFDPSENYISALGVFPDGRVLVGGEFGEYGPRIFQNLALWNGTNWQGTGLGFEDGSTTTVGSDGYDVAVAPNGQVFVGGGFEHIGGIPYSHIAMWDGNLWHDLAGGVSGDVSSLVIHGDYLYVGGGFATVGDGLASPRVARWHIPSQTWSAVGTGFPGGYVSTMAFVGDTLFVGGSGFAFDDECCVLKWNPDENGGAWQAFSDTFITDRYVSGICCAQTSVQAMASDDEVLMVGGFWVDVETRVGRDEVTEGDLFLYHPASDSVATFGTGIDGNSLVSVDEITFTHSGVYIGGEFGSIDGLLASNIARLTADGWSSLNVKVEGDDAVVKSIVQNGDELFIAGAFSEIGGIPAFNVARLDLTTNRWSALGCGIVRTTDSLRTNSVRGLAVQPSGSPNAGLFATGGIFRAGCTSSTGFAAWYGVGQEDENDQVQPRFPINVFGNNPVALRHSIFLPVVQK